MDFDNDVLNASREIPVLAVFSNATCGYCRGLKAVLAANPREDIIYIHIDVDQNPEVIDIYKIRSVPTMMLFNIGKSIARLNGSVSGVQLNNWLEANLPVEWTEVTK